ncbi:MAG: phospholipase D family protein [Candidatus Hydrothermae bacterium]|nr:phospholipase D family protein [Candidatus Hydrothermae bacterium]
MSNKIIPLIGPRFPDRVIPLVERAKKSIDILVYDWRWYPDDIGASIQIFNQTILKKAKQGVRVRAILNNNQTGCILQNNNCEARIKNFKNLLHAKLMLIDDNISILGSHNYTKNAFERNLEVSIIIFNEKLNKIYREYFENIWP